MLGHSLLLLSPSPSILLILTLFLSLIYFSLSLWLYLQSIFSAPHDNFSLSLPPVGRVADVSA